VCPKELVGFRFSDRDISQEFFDAQSCAIVRR